MAMLIEAESMAGALTMIFAPVVLMTIWRPIMRTLRPFWIEILVMVIATGVRAMITRFPPAVVIVILIVIVAVIAIIVVIICVFEIVRALMATIAWR